MAGLRAVHVLVALIVAMGAVGGGASAARAATDEATFRSIYDEAARSAPIFGPQSGSLNLDFSRPDYADTYLAGVWAQDAVVHAVIAVPANSPGDNWRVSVGLRVGLDVHYRFWVGSDGAWQWTEGYGAATDQGKLAHFDGAPGGQNVIDVAASGTFAYVAVNDVFVAKLPMAQAIGQGDYSISAGGSASTASFQEFTVWSLDPKGFVYRRGAAQLGSSSAGSTLFESVMTSIDGYRAESGPDSGVLTIADESSLPTATAAADARDFVLRASFTSPFTPDSDSWDVGVIFRAGNAPEFRFIVDSAGHWYFTFASGDPVQRGFVANLQTAAGGTTTIDLVAIGDRGFVGVNGHYLATLDLAIGDGGGGVKIASAFFGDDTKVGAVIPFDNFTVWSLDDA